ncbi:unnamed protein product [Rodentolepis nana]|uniref:Secreted protein n=1 Tax=Rodentolepis nana TaxID=102285 RepID=A0A0R3T3M1_RODNA|nr:unnamed protein product [Rodentolepis nana]
MWVECILPICEGVHVFAKQSCPSAMSESATVHCFSVVRALSSLNLEVWKVGYVGVATVHCFSFGAMSEIATVHCFSFVRALSSFNLEVWNSLLIKAYICGKTSAGPCFAKSVSPS